MASLTTRRRTRFRRLFGASSISASTGMLGRSLRPQSHSCSNMKGTRPANQAAQRTGANRFVQRQIERQRRLAPVADLFRSAFFRAMKLVISILFLLVAVVIPSQAAPQELPADAATALRAPTNIVLYSLEPLERPSANEQTLNGVK